MSEQTTSATSSRSTAAARKLRGGLSEKLSGGFSGFDLKVLAIIAMTCNHAAWIFGDALPPVLLCIFFAVGGLTFPIMVFLLHEGYVYTSNLGKYAQRLLIFAIIAQLPYWLFLSETGNVLFTLLICLLVFWLYDTVKDPRIFWVTFALMVLVSAVCDWGILGPLMALMLHMKPGREGVVYAALFPIVAEGLPMLFTLIVTPTAETLGLTLYALVGCSASIPLLWAYNGQRGRPLKWFFYAYYPAHIIVLGLLANLL